MPTRAIRAFSQRSFLDLMMGFMVNAHKMVEIQEHLGSTGCKGDMYPPIESPRMAGTGKHLN